MMKKYKYKNKKNENRKTTGLGNDKRQEKQYANRQKEVL